MSADRDHANRLSRRCNRRSCRRRIGWSAGAIRWRRVGGVSGRWQRRCDGVFGVRRRTCRLVRRASATSRPRQTSATAPHESRRQSRASTDPLPYHTQITIRDYASIPATCAVALLGLIAADPCRAHRAGYPATTSQRRSASGRAALAKPAVDPAGRRPPRPAAEACLRLARASTRTSTKMTTTGASAAAGINGEIGDHVEFQIERDLNSDGRWRDVFAQLADVPAGRGHGRPLQSAVRARRARSASPTSISRFAALVSRPFRRLATSGVMVHGRFLRRGFTYEVGVFDDDGDNGSLKEAQFSTTGEIRGHWPLLCWRVDGHAAASPGRDVRHASRWLRLRRGRRPRRAQQLARRDGLRNRLTSSHPSM